MGVKSVHKAEHFPFASVKMILKTEEYTGCMVMQKEHNISPKHQRLNRGEVPKYKVDDHHEAIIDREPLTGCRKSWPSGLRKTRARRGLTVLSLVSSAVGNAVGRFPATGPRQAARTAIADL